MADLIRIANAASALLDEINSGSGGTSNNTIVVSSRPPRIEIAPRMDLECAPPTSEVLDRWQAGLRASDSNEANVIKIFDIIGSGFFSEGITAKSVSRQLEQIGAENPVQVHINSPGGDMFEGIAIYNIIRDHKGPVNVKVMGLAASAASAIAMAGDTREIGESAFIMIHNAWVMAMGNRHDMTEVAAYLTPFDAALRDIYARRTGQKPDQVAAWMDAETFFNGTQAVDLTFATSLLSGDLVEDSVATERAKAMHAKRTLEALLTRKCNMTRSQARALISEISGKPGAATEIVSTMRDAGALPAKQDAGADLANQLAALTAKIVLAPKI